MLVRVWQENQGILQSIVRNILLDRSIVEDVLQEAFARLLQSNRHFPNERETYNYVRRVVLNTTIDYYRRLNRRNSQQRMFLAASSRDHPNPLTLLIREEEDELQTSVLKEVDKALKTLSREQKRAIDLVFHRNKKKLKEICKETGIPYSTLRSRVMAGIDQIRKQLKAKGVYESYERVKRT